MDERNGKKMKLKCWSLCILIKAKGQNWKYAFLACDVSEVVKGKGALGQPDKQSHGFAYCSISTRARSFILLLISYNYISSS